MALTKKAKVIQEKIDTFKDYSIEEAIELLKSAPKAKFNESVDLSVILVLMQLNRSGCTVRRYLMGLERLRLL